MSEVDVGPKLFFEGFLRKRKDKLKVKWVTYWFRLHNTTLFFYTKKEGRHASNLRGQYYIYTVQSVREVTEGKRHTFEITMKNGKRKMLAAETPEMRREWVSQLWKAMQLSGSGRSRSLCAWPKETGELKARAFSSPCASDQQVTELMESRGQSPQEPSGQDRPHSSTWPTAAHPYPAHTVNTAFSRADSCNSHSFTTEYKQMQEQNQRAEESLYDTLPPARKSLAMIESIYDTPASCRRGIEQPQSYREATESIYDVPKSLLRKMSEHTLESRVRDDQLETVS
ncbi:interactor protein for cytohesin exchange factors 1 [Sardina pilchardus]|uniref:interactor protein for cytohesin exchange factors 1 n=1 Tax=Sardina pilchardus TaxID=27697 RepID=UPI002E124321